VQYKYKDFVENNLVQPGHEDFFPCVVPNWDNTPRVSRKGFVLTGRSPELFRRQLLSAVRQVENRSDDKRIVFVKSWNEWAEGNYLEPDSVSGRSYLDVCRDVFAG
jgi:hypothetical protein